MPRRPAEFSVGDALETQFLLEGHSVADGAVFFNFSKGVGIDRVGREGRTRLQEVGWSQQTSDVIGAGRVGSFVVSCRKLYLLSNIKNSRGSFKRKMNAAPMMSEGRSRSVPSSSRRMFPSMDSFLTFQMDDSARS